MKINRSELISHLTKAKTAFAQKSILVSKEVFVFTGSEICSFGENISVSTPFTTDFKCAIDGNNLIKVISNLTSEVVDINLKDSKLLIVGGKARASLYLEDDFTYSPLDRDDIISKGIDIPQDFKEAISFCSISVSKVALDGVMQNIFIEDDIMASSDNFRISEFTMTSKIDGSILVPGVSIVEVMKYDIKSYLVDGKSHIYLIDKDKAIFLVNLVIGDFPRYEDILDSISMKKKVIFPEQFVEKVNAASIFIQQEDNSKEIKVTIQKDKIVCDSTNEVGSICIDTDVTQQDKQAYQGSFTVNPIYLKDILQHVNTAVTAYVDNNKLYFQDKQFKHLICLIIDNA